MISTHPLKPRISVMPATLILVEGTDGTGKSQFISHLSSKLTPLESVTDVHTKAFPTTNPPVHVKQSQTSGILFFLDDFNDAFRDLSCSRNDLVVCDRSFLSTLVYQGFKGNHSLTKGRFYESIMTLGENTFFGHTDFDKVHMVLLTCSSETAQNRIQQRASDKDSIDSLEGHEQKMRIEALAMRYQIVVSDLKERWNRSLPFRPDPVENTEPHFHKISTEKETSENLAESFVASTMGK